MTTIFQESVRRIIAKISIFSLLLNVSAIPLTNSYFTDQTSIAANTIAAGDWTAPLVTLDSPSHNQVLTGVIDIYGSVTDNDPHHYWLVVENSTGTVIAGPGVVNRSTSFTSELLYSWDTSSFPDGIYTIKLEARDNSGNKAPNLSPVNADPEDFTDSVDWINVTVANHSVSTPLVYDVDEAVCGADQEEELVSGQNILGTDTDGVSFDLLASSKYIFRASGTYQYDTNNPNKLADAGYATGDNWLSLRSDIGIAPSSTYRGVTSLLGDLGQGVGIIPWGAYQMSHTYAFSYTPILDTTARFVISDWYGDWYSSSYANQSASYDNSGFITLNVYRCVANNNAPSPTPSPTPDPTPSPTPTPTPSPTPSPTPTPTPTPTTAGVVINEIMWMGTTQSTADEWIELRNLTDQAVDVGQWEIENARHLGNNKISIPASQSIPANGYLLIANYPNNASNTELNVDVDVVSNITLLNSGNGNLILRDKDNNIVDTALGSSSWPAGENGSPAKHSMERNDIPGDGLNALNWHTCVDDVCNDGNYWKTAEGNNYGTPGGQNHSANDSSVNDEETTTITDSDDNSISQESDLPGDEATQTLDSDSQSTTAASPSPSPEPQLSPDPSPSPSPTPSPALPTSESPPPSSSTPPPSDPPPALPEVEKETSIEDDTNQPAPVTTTTDVVLPKSDPEPEITPTNNE